MLNYQHIFAVVVLISTCASSLQSKAVCCHHARVSNQPRVSHSHVKGASGNVAPIELDIYGVDSVLPWNEADCILVWTQHKWGCYWSVTHKWCSQIFKKNNSLSPEVYFVRWSEVRAYRCQAQWHSTPLKSRRGCELWRQPHLERRCAAPWRTPLGLPSGPSPGKEYNQNIMCVYAYVRVCARTSRDTKCVTHAWTRIDWAVGSERQKRSELTARRLVFFAPQADEQCYQS